jgi:NAD(P)-dependent dehydrogenase (short-subunit alcohol dehydrogenase family)
VKSLRGKVVVITGAGSGIGRATALAFAEHGSIVHVVDVVPDRVRDVCGEISKQGHQAEGHQAQGHVVDCADADAVADLAARIEAQHGRVDVLQNGVGILVAAPVGELSREDWRRAIGVNLGSVINGVSGFLPGMLRRNQRAHIVNIASVAGLVAFPYTAPYSTSKFAIVGLSEALAYELGGTPVGVTVVCPGMVRSNLVTDGLMKLPPPWPRVFDRAYAAMADDPTRIARAVVRAVQRNEPMVVPATLLPQLWYLERLGGKRFHRGARALTHMLRTAGSWVGRRWT